MTGRPGVEFALVPIAALKAHEEYEEENVLDLMEEIRGAGVFADPIWVARGSLVILNGHHRVEAARRLGLARVPAFVLDYESDVVSLEPWRPGLPITKAEVVDRAGKGELFPPKTTRHRVRVELAAAPVPLAELTAEGRAGGPPSRQPGRSRAAGDATRPG